MPPSLRLTARTDTHSVFGNPIYVILTLIGILFVLGAVFWGIHACFPNSVLFSWYGNRPAKRQAENKASTAKREELELIKRLRAGKKAEEERLRKKKSAKDLKDGKVAVKIVEVPVVGVSVEERGNMPRTNDHQSRRAAPLPPSVATEAEFV